MFCQKRIGATLKGGRVLLSEPLKQRFPIHLHNWLHRSRRLSGWCYDFRSRVSSLAPKLAQLLILLAQPGLHGCKHLLPVHRGSRRNFSIFLWFTTACSNAVGLPCHPVYAWNHDISRNMISIYLIPLMQYSSKQFIIQSFIQITGSTRTCNNILLLVTCNTIHAIHHAISFYC